MHSDLRTFRCKIDKWGGSSPQDSLLQGTEPLQTCVSDLLPDKEFGEDFPQLTPHPGEQHWTRYRPFLPTAIRLFNTVYFHSIYHTIDLMYNMIVQFMDSMVLVIIGLDTFLFSQKSYGFVFIPLFLQMHIEMNSNLI